MTTSLLWVLAALCGAGAQTARNAMQGRLAGAIGTVGATQVRFLYGFPFALLFLGVVWLVTAEPIPGFNASFLAFATGGAVAQIAGTAFMIAAMRERSFSVAIAYTKTEPVQVALFSLLVLGERLGWLGGAGVITATLGIIAMSWQAPGAASTSSPAGRGALWRPTLFGLLSGAGFAIAAVSFRGAILALEGDGLILRSTTALAVTLGLQSLMLGLYLALRDRRAFFGSVRVWRSSLFAGFMGALASQFWFFAFALTSAANVRTLALVEVLFAQVVSRRLFRQSLTRREALGMALIVLGVGLVLGGL